MKLEFRSKHVPFVTQGRLQHLLFGFLVALGGGLAATWKGVPFSHGAAWGLVIAFMFGLIWELLTPLLAHRWFKSWTHPFGDYLDFAYYCVGALILALTSSIGGC